ncbi:DNA-3-methyladenine glycosylase [Thermoleophilia bacterium SCSIO 60948]|nr:DNA-3-methyladenine glycosylase [Thermoleophilia bacterium SCSIO 60948]
MPAPTGKPLGSAFFDRSAHDVARDLLGATLRYGGVGGVIVETESYVESDPACHAHVGVTARTSTLFDRPGIAYVYLSYGIHSLLNCVTEPEGEAGAVLIRGLRPVWGIDAMLRRRNVARGELCSGPGKLTQALGIGLDDNARPLDAEPFELRGRDPSAPPPPIVTGPRIGITKGVEFPWRYCVRGERDVSRPRPPGWALGAD